MVSNIVVYLLIAQATSAVGAQVHHAHLIVIAHRGDPIDTPEYTLKAFEDAIATGVDYVEVDVRNSRDRELVVIGHDATVDREMDHPRELVRWRNRK